MNHHRRILDRHEARMAAEPVKSVGANRGVSAPPDDTLQISESVAAHRYEYPIV
jgi:hypothetical protein